MTEGVAMTLLHRLQAAGFSSGISCAAYCVHGHNQRTGEPKSDRWGVSCTPMERAMEFTQAVEDGGRVVEAHTRHGTCFITDWEPVPVAEIGAGTDG